MRLALIVVITSLTSVAAAHARRLPDTETAAQAKDQQQILILEQALGKAIADGDVAAYDKLTSTDFQFITGAGAIVSKAERLALLQKGPTPGFRTSGHAIRIYGNVAVVTGRQGPGEGAVRFTRVWVRQGREWRAVVTQVTSIQPKP